jgi:hypothetical protein
LLWNLHSIRNTTSAFPLLEISSMDITTAMLSFTVGGSIGELTSTYLPCDSDELPPSAELLDVITHCSRSKLKLITGCYTNAHGIIWDSAGIKQRGHHLLEYLLSTKFNILNKAKDPTADISSRQKVICFTLRIDNLRDLVSNWHAYHKISLSDHRYTRFQVLDLEFSKVT